MNFAYKFVRRHPKLFETYFSVFCDIFKKRRSLSKLLDMIYDCELVPGCIHFLKNIFFCLIRCGSSKLISCHLILSRCKSESFQTFNVLIDIIILSDAVQFCDAINKYNSFENYIIPMELINRLAEKAIQTRSNKLSTVVLKCLSKVNEKDLVGKSSKEVREFLEMVRSKTFLAKEH